MTSEARRLAGERIATAHEATAALRSIEGAFLRIATHAAPDAGAAAERRRTRWLDGAIAVATAAGLALAIGLAALTVAPRVFAVQALVVLSGSMEPALPVGSMVVLERVDATAIGVGDVITFARPDRPSELVTHRVVSEQTAADGARQLVTKGDANAVPDPWVVPAKGIGWRVVNDVPIAGYVLAALRSSVARLALFVLPLIGLAALALRAIWRSAGR